MGPHPAEFPIETSHAWVKAQGNRAHHHPFPVHWMCTLIVLHRCDPDAPVVVAANRDEFHERPTEGPTLREVSQNGRRIAAPRDLRAGGTWLGVNDAGVFAAVTNRRSKASDPERRSRGWLVIEALALGSAREAAERMADAPERAYNPFNFFVADAESAHLVSYADAPECRDLEPGLHVVGNLHPDESSPKLERLRREAEPLTEPGAATPEALAAMCRDHGPSPGSALDATCVHAGDYGTGSSTLLRTGRRPLLHFSEGPPCRTPYRDSTPLLHALGTVPVPEGVQARG